MGHFVFWDLFMALLIGQQIRQERGGWHAAKGHRSDSNPGSLQWGQSLCTWDIHCTSWASGCPKWAILNLVAGQFWPTGPTLGCFVLNWLIFLQRFGVIRTWTLVDPSHSFDDLGLHSKKKINNPRLGVSKLKQFNYLATMIVSLKSDIMAALLYTRLWLRR